MSKWILCQKHAAGFVPNVRHLAVSFDLKAFVASSSVATRNHTDSNALFLQMLHQCYDSGRFPTAACDDVANHNDGNADCMDFKNASLVKFSVRKR